MTSTKSILEDTMVRLLLAMRIRKKIKQLQSEGITGMSKSNMKQIISVADLLCSADEFHKQFDLACESFGSFLYD